MRMALPAGRYVLGRAVAKVFTGQIIGQLASFATSVLVARQIGPEAFGIYSFAVVGGMLLSGVPGAGLDISAVRISGRYWAHEPTRARAVLLLAGLGRGGIGIAVALLGLAFGPWLASTALGRPELVEPVRIAVVGGLVLAMREYALAVLQARERFGAMVVMNVLSALARIGSIGLLGLLGALTLGTSMLAFLVACCAACAVGLLMAGRTLRGPAALTRGVAGELALFSRWLVLATMLGTAANNLDVLVLTRLSGPQSTGVYLAARTLALPIGLVGAAVSTALLPRLSRLGHEQLGPYVRDVGLRLAALCLVGADALLVAAPAIFARVYGDQYVDGVPVFRLLVVLFAAQLSSWPAIALLLVLDRPDMVAKLNLLLLVVTGAAYVAVVPSLGALGTAGVYAAGVVLALPVCYAVAWSALPRRATPAVGWTVVT